MKEPLAMSFEHSLVVHFAPFQLMLLCIIGPVILALLGLIMIRKVTPHESLKQYHDIAGPFLNTIGAIYGIFLALVVATPGSYTPPPDPTSSRRRAASRASISTPRPSPRPSVTRSGSSCVITGIPW